MGFADNPNQEAFKDIDISERGRLPKSADLYWNLFEVFVYGYKYDTIIRSSLKNRRSIEDPFSQAEVSHLWKNMSQAYTTEMGLGKEKDETADASGDEKDPDADDKTALKLLDATKSTAELLLAQHASNMEASDRQKVEAFAIDADRKLRFFAQLHAEPDDSPDLTRLIAESTAGKMRGSKKCYVIIVCDARLLCECGNQAKYRHPPIRVPQLKKLLNAVVDAREGTLDPFDVLIAGDGFRRKDFDDKLTKTLDETALQTKLTWSKSFAVYDYESLVAKMGRDSGGVVDQMETINMLSNEPLDIAARPRLKLPNQTTRGNCIGTLPHDGGLQPLPPTCTARRSLHIAL